MPPLSATQKDTESPKTSAKAASAGNRSNGSKAASSEWTKLGYEVFNKRRISHVQVPLSVSASANASSYTGSALLDSFVRDRTVEPPALKALRLVNVNDSVDSKPVDSTPKTAENSARQDSARQDSARQDSTTQDSTDAAQNTTIIQPSPASQIETEQIEAAQIETEQIEAEQTEEPSNAERIAFEQAVASEQAVDLEQADSERVSERVEVQKLFVEIQEPDPDQDLPDQDLPDQDLLDQPPAEAEPAHLDNVPTPPRLPAQPPKPVSLPYRPAPAVSTGSHYSTPVDHEKRARDGAASVGLIDITDTLLFGGDRPDLVSADPFIPQGSEANIPGVLAYLTKQISAFTVDRLQSGFPHNTDPRVINRLDPPKHNTVLDLENFKLGDLTNLEPEPKTLKSQSAQNPADVHTLSQQVEALNRKIAYLSEKLAQVADTAE